MMLAEAQHNLAQYTTELQTKKTSAEEAFKVAEMQHAEMYKVFNDTKKWQPAASLVELQQLQEDYKEAL